MKKSIPILLVIVLIAAGGYFIAPDILDKFNTEPVADEQLEEPLQVFLNKRGNPGIFMTLFAYADLNGSGMPVALDDPLRLDTWTFGEPSNVVTQFENRVFVSEESLTESVALMNHQVSPLDFTLSSTPQLVINMLGEADCEHEEEAGEDTLRTLKYNETDSRPLVSVSFSDENILSVMVGIAFTDDAGQTILCP